MRSHSIVKSLDTGQSRFALCHQAFKAIRKLHNSANRIQDTATDALQRLSGTEYQLMPEDPNGSVAPLEVDREVVIEPQAEASAPERIAGVPPAGPTAATGNDRPAAMTGFWLRNR
jgi:hypothetical protein